MTTLAELETDPYVPLAGLREREPVAWSEALGGWLVTSRALADEVLLAPGRFTADSPESMNLRILGEHMLNREGEEHRRHRGAFDPGLRFRPVRDSYTTLVERHVDGLVAAIAPLGAADLRASLARLLPVRVMADVLDLGEVDPVVLGDWYDDFALALGNYARDPEIERRARAAQAELHARLQPGAAGLVGAAGARLAGDELARNVSILLFGGIETAESMILNTLWLLLRHPDAMAAVLREPALAERAVEESLRLEPPVGVLDRWAVEDTELGGVPIARGDWVNISVGAANRDPAVFPDPDRFDLARPNVSRHLAFGFGPHLCIGFNLARLEGQAAVRGVLAALPGLELDPERPTAPRGFAFRKPPHLCVRWRATRA